MPFHESVIVALLLLAIVFFVLFCLYSCIRFFSFVVKKIEKSRPGGEK